MYLVGANGDEETCDWKNVLLTTNRVLKQDARESFFISLYLSNFLFQRISILGLFNARSCMIFEARSSSLRCTK